MGTLGLLSDAPDGPEENNTVIFISSGNDVDPDTLNSMSERERECE